MTKSCFSNRHNSKLVLPELRTSSKVAILGVFKDMLKKDVIVAAYAE